MEDGAPPPPPPPHGSTPRPPGGLPDGNYDIFIIPPHSAGGGFLYLPSLQPQRNSFIAGVLVALALVGIYITVMPVLKAWLATIMAGNALGVLILAGIVGLVAWTVGKTAGEGGTGTQQTGGSASGAGQQRYKAAGPEAHGYAPPPPPPPPPRAEPDFPPPRAEPDSPPPGAGAKSGWEKAREDTRKREEERKRAEDLAKKREAAQKLREEADRLAKAQAEKEKWEQARLREKEQRERESRERLAREKLARDREIREKDAREREAREKSAQSTTDRLAALRAQRDERLRTSSATSAQTSPATTPQKPYIRPSARSAVGTEDEHSFRPYDTPPKPRIPHSSASSISGLSESSYAPSQSTARTTPPPRHRGPYTTSDPCKIILKAVYRTSDSFPKPSAQLLASTGSVSDGLVLKIQTEGLFIDDDVRGVAQREWDVKAWTLKAVEEGKIKIGEVGLCLFRATVKDQVKTRYTFVLSEAEAWKVGEGVKRLKGGSQVRGLAAGVLKENEIKSVLAGLGWV